MSEPVSFFEELKQLVINYFEARIQLSKITAYEKIAKVTGVFFSSLIIVLLGFFLLFFLSIIGGFYFGELLNNTIHGFLIVLGIHLILFFISIIFRKKLLEHFIINKVIEQLFEQEKHD